MTDHEKDRNIKLLEQCFMSIGPDGLGKLALFASIYSHGSAPDQMRGQSTGLAFASGMQVGLTIDRMLRELSPIYADQEQEIQLSMVMLVVGMIDDHRSIGAPAPRLFALLPSPDELAKAMLAQIQAAGSSPAGSKFLTATAEFRYSADFKALDDLACRMVSETISRLRAQEASAQYGSGYSEPAPARSAPISLSGADLLGFK